MAEVTAAPGRQWPRLLLVPARSTSPSVEVIVTHEPPMAMRENAEWRAHVDEIRARSMALAVERGHLRR